LVLFEVGAMRDHMRAGLTIAALTMAIQRRRGPALLGWPEPIAQQSARPENGEPPLGNVDVTAGARVATVSSANAPRPKRAETAQVGPIAATQRGDDLVEERPDEDPRLPLGEVRVGLD
jgi:hypothetical protein